MYKCKTDRFVAGNVQSFSRDAQFIGPSTNRAAAV